MSYAQFQEHWEQEADKERLIYDVRPVAELLADVRVKRFGNYYQIWTSIGSRASLAEAGSLLADVLESDVDYLNRYHCAAALISISRTYSDGFRPEQLSADKRYPIHQRICELRQKLKI
ncbi:MAG TPA: hypothetical protein VGO57_11385 [Verrucomicrobiae bacterium]|jgi:hypothetical protein